MVEIFSFSSFFLSLFFGIGFLRVQAAYSRLIRCSIAGHVSAPILCGVKTARLLRVDLPDCRYPVSMVGLFPPRREHATNIEFRQNAHCIEDFLDLFPANVPVTPSPIKPFMNKMSHSIYEPPDSGAAIGYSKVIYPSSHYRSNVL